MKLCFLIYSWFPYGGQQRDFLRVVDESVRRGHTVHIYAMKWQGERPEGVTITMVPVTAISRHGLYQRFTKWVQEAIEADPVDAVIGFNKMPGLDIYFAADPCFAEKALNQRGLYYRFMPRYKHFAEYEHAVFGTASKTQVLILSPLQRLQFSKHYPGCEARMHDIPPGISPDRRAPDNAAEIRVGFRKEIRNEFSLHEQQYVVVQIGSGFVIKGVDRSLRAIAALPAEIRDRATYILVGQDKPHRFQRLAAKLGITRNCIFAGGRDDIPRFLLGADLLLHPAYSESAGYVLLEATIAGLPVLTTDTCGYAFHVETAGSGQVCTSPFAQSDLNQRLARMLTSEQASQWRANGVKYGQEADLYSMPETAVDLIEKFTVSEMREVASGSVLAR